MLASRTAGADLETLLNLYDDENTNDEQIIFSTFEFVQGMHGVVESLLLESRFKEASRCLDICEDAMPSDRIRIKENHRSTSESKDTRRMLYLAQGDMSLFLALQKRTMRLRQSLAKEKEARKALKPPPLAVEQTAAVSLYHPKRPLLDYGPLGLARTVPANEKAPPAVNGRLFVQRTVTPVSPPKRGVVAKSLKVEDSYRVLPPLVTESRTLWRDYHTYHPVKEEEGPVAFSFGDHDQPTSSSSRTAEDAEIPLYLRTANKELELFSDDDEEVQHLAELRRQSTFQRRRTLNPLDELFVARSSLGARSSSSVSRTRSRRHSIQVPSSPDSGARQEKVHRLASQHKMALQLKKRETFWKTVKNKQWRRASPTGSSPVSDDNAFPTADMVQSPLSSMADDATTETNSMHSTGNLAQDSIRRAYETIGRVQRKHSAADRPSVVEGRASFARMFPALKEDEEKPEPFSTTTVPHSVLNRVKQNPKVAEDLLKLENDGMLDRQRVREETEEWQRRAAALYYQPPPEEKKEEKETDVVAHPQLTSPTCVPVLVNVSVMKDGRTLKGRESIVVPLQEVHSVQVLQEEEDEEHSIHTAEPPAPPEFNPAVRTLVRRHMENKQRKEVPMRGKEADVNPQWETKPFAEESRLKCLPDRVKRHYGEVLTKRTEMMEKEVKDIKASTSERAARSVQVQSFDATDVEVQRVSSMEYENEPMLLPNPFERDLVETVGITKTFDSGLFNQSEKSNIGVIPSLEILKHCGQSWETIPAQTLANCLPLLVATYRIQRTWRGYRARQVVASKQRQVMAHIMKQERNINAVLAMQRAWRRFRARNAVASMMERKKTAMENRPVMDPVHLEAFDDRHLLISGERVVDHGDQLPLYDVPPHLTAAQASTLGVLQEHMAARRIAGTYQNYLHLKVNRMSEEAHQLIGYVTQKGTLSLSEGTWKERLGFEDVGRYTGDVYGKYLNRVEKVRATGSSYFVPWEKVSMTELRKVKEANEEKMRQQQLEEERRQMHLEEQAKQLERRRWDAALVLQRVGRAYRYRFWLNQLYMNSETSLLQHNGGEAVEEVSYSLQPQAAAGTSLSRAPQYSQQLLNEMTARLGIIPSKATADEINESLLLRDSHNFIVAQLKERHPMWFKEAFNLENYEEKTVRVVQAFFRAKLSAEVSFQRYLDFYATKIQRQWRAYKRRSS